MNEKWLALAKRIADLERQVATATRERDEYKAMYELREAQLQKEKNK